MNQERSLGEKVALFVIFLCISIPLGFLAFNCTDYSETLKKFAIPVQEEVVSFYSKHLRYPNLKEATELIKKSGCKNIRIKEYIERKNDKGKIFKRWGTYDCDFGTKKIDYGVSIGDPSIPYSGHVKYFGFGLGYKNSHCSSNFTKEGTLRSKIWCQQSSCIFNHWGH